MKKTIKILLSLMLICYLVSCDNANSSTMTNTFDSALSSTLESQLISDNSSSITYDALFPVEINRKYEYIHKSGEVITQLNADNAYAFSDSMALFKSGGLYGFIDLSGQPTIPCQYVTAHSFSEGLCAVSNSDGLWGYIDKRNALVINYQFTDAAEFSEGVAMVKTEAYTFAYINKNGEILLEFDTW